MLEKPGQLVLFVEVVADIKKVSSSQMALNLKCSPEKKKKSYIHHGTVFRHKES